MAGVEHVLSRQLARTGAADACAGRDQQRLVRALQRLAHRLDGADVLRAVGDEVGEVVIESAVDDRVRPGGAVGQGLRIFKIGAMRLRTRSRQRARPGVGTRHSQNPVAAARSSGMIREPMKPVAPVRNTRMIKSPLLNGCGVAWRFVLLK